MLTVNELQDLSLKQLSDLHAKVGQAMLIVRQRERDTVKAKIEAAARAAGFTVKDLLRTAPRSRARRNTPMYVNPKAPTETWAGRGRRPAWLAAALDAGKPLERFLNR